MASSVSITWTNICQPIDGFGASSAFTGGSITAAQADLFFSQSLGIGLSFVRADPNRWNRRADRNIASRGESWGKGLGDAVESPCGLEDK